MNCENALKALASFADNELPAHEAAAVGEHLRSCVSCSAEHEALRQVGSALRALPLRPLPPGFLAKVRARHEEAGGAPSPFWVGFSLKPFAFAAAAVVVVLVVRNPWRPDAKWRRAPGEPIAQTATLPPLRTPLDELKADDSPRASKNLAPAPASGSPGSPIGEARGLTNEQLQLALREESDRLGIEPAPKEEEAPHRTQPFMGEKLGQPGTREQAEESIRELAAMRRSIDEGARAGKPAEVPIAGRVAPVLGSVGAADDGKAIEPGALADGYWSGDYSAGNEGTRTIDDAREWAALWRTLSSSPVPPVDFRASQVLAIFLGPRPTGGYSVEIVDVAPAGRGFLVRYREHAPAFGQTPPENATSPYALKAVPRSSLPARFEKVR